MKVEEFRKKLITEIAKCENVKGIGQTGNVHAPLVPGQSDIDFFVICTTVPEKEERLELYSAFKQDYDELNMEVVNGGIWGHGDVFNCQGIDIMPMYFTIKEMMEYVEEVLQGKHLDREGLFYPIGRLASIETLNILYEADEAWTKIQSIARQYPEELFRSLYTNHSRQILDQEDLGRVMLRKEVLFYHQVLEEAIDHMLQALYAINKCYFPSRKRTEQAMEKFTKKPVNCYIRLCKIVADSVREDTMEASVIELKELAQEVFALGERVFG